MADVDIYEEMVRRLKARYPRFREIYKAESTLHRTIGKLAFWMYQRDPVTKKIESLYMTRYISVLGFVVAYPSIQWRKTNPFPWKILAHEGQHMVDRAGLKLLFDFGYGFPQNLVPLSVLGFWSPWCLLFLLAALPLPAPFRAWAELRGYTMTMAVNYWRYGSVKQATIDNIVKQFTGPAYYYMWPFEKAVRRRLAQQLEKIESGEILKLPWFAEVKKVIDAQSG